MLTKLVYAKIDDLFIYDRTHTRHYYFKGYIINKHVAIKYLFCYPPQQRKERYCVTMH